jgi:hypothetical protein
MFIAALFPTNLELRAELFLPGSQGVGGRGEGIGVRGEK